MKTTQHKITLASTGITDLGQVAGLIANQLNSLSKYTVRFDTERTPRALWLCGNLPGTEAVTFFFSFDTDGSALDSDPALGMVYTKHAYEFTAYIEDGAAILTYTKILREG